jgi:hypothetical protein
MTASDLIETIDQRARALLLEVAVHEAGHSVVGRLLGLPCGSATIRDGHGRSWCRRDGGRNSILVTLAGRSASEVILGFASDPGCQADDDKALALVEAGGIGDRLQAWDAVTDRLGECHALIRQHRATIAMVALGLLAKGTLTGDEIDQLIQET